MLGLATGSTPIGVYRELIRMHREEGLSFANVVTFNLDEYYPMAPDSIHCYHRFMWENLFAHVDIEPENVHIPRGDVPRERGRGECARVRGGDRDARAASTSRSSASARPATSASTSPARARTAARASCTSTRSRAATRPPTSSARRTCPREAITMGVATILEAREIAILATGEHKAAIVKRAVEGEIDLEVAATFLQRHPNTTFYLDRAAGGRAHAHRDAVAARRGALDAASSRCAP